MRFKTVIMTTGKSKPPNTTSGVLTFWSKHLILQCCIMLLPSFVNWTIKLLQYVVDFLDINCEHATVTCVIQHRSTEKDIFAININYIAEPIQIFFTMMNEWSSHKNICYYRYITWIPKFRIIINEMSYCKREGILKMHNNMWFSLFNLFQSIKDYIILTFN